MLRTLRGRLQRIATVVIAIGVSFAVDTARAIQEPKEILVLYSTRRDAQIVTVGDREIPRILEKGLPEGLDYYSEFIDEGRFSEDDYQAAFGEFLGLKYRGRQFDLIIAMGESPLEFLTEHRNELFKGVPLVYFADRSGRVPKHAERHGCHRQGESRRHRQPRHGAAARHEKHIRGQRCRRERLARGGAATASPVRTTARRHLSGRSAGRRSGSAAGTIARAFHRLLPGGRSRRRRRKVSSAGIPEPRHGDRECAGVFVGRLRDGSRHRRRQPQRSGCAGPGRRRSCAAGAARRAGRQHSAGDTGSQRRASGLAPAAALGHQRVARPCRNHHPVQGTNAVGSLCVLHHRRGGRRVRTVGVDWRIAHSTQPAAPGRGASSSSTRSSCGRVTIASATSARAC